MHATRRAHLHIKLDAVVIFSRRIAITTIIESAVEVSLHTTQSERAEERHTDCVEEKSASRTKGVTSLSSK